MQKYIHILLCVLALSACAAPRQKPQVVRTTTTTQLPLTAAGAGGISTTVTEAPYESPAYTAAGKALFSR